MRPKQEVLSSTNLSDNGSVDRGPIGQRVLKGSLANITGSNVHMKVLLRDFAGKTQKV